MLKKCNKCKEEKEFTEFSKAKTCKDGHRNQCKSCRKEINKETKRKHYENKKEHYKEYREKTKERRKEYWKEYYENNKENIKEYYKKYRENNKEKIKEKQKKYYIKNKRKKREYINKYDKNRRQTDALYKLRRNISVRISQSIKNKGYTKQSQTYKILGCTYKEFKEHLENQFKDGMSWKNQGKWHLDHIIPISSAKTEEDVVRLNHYTNFQPLWAEDNLKKSNKIL